MRIVLIIIVLLLVGCQEYTPKVQYVSTIIDLTESNSYQPKAEEILSYVTKGDTSDGLELSLCYVGETRYVNSYQFELPVGETGWLSNEDTRRTKRRIILTSFKDTILQHKKKFYLRSEIFRLVTYEVNRLSKIDGNVSLLLYSDLKEHSSLFSVYDNKQLKLLYRAPKLLAKQFSEAEPLLKDLSGITIHILHQPKLQDDGLFTALVALYKVIFESRGATVKVSKTHKFSLQ